MADEMSGALERLESKLQQHLESARKTKLAINALCEAFDKPPLYGEVDEKVDGLRQIRSDQFYGQPLATCIRSILELRKSSGRGAASVNEIFDALSAGGYRFETKDDENAKTGLRQSLRKNPIFHKLPGGQWGLLAWYPNAKVEKEDPEPVGTKSPSGVASEGARATASKEPRDDVNDRTASRAD